jgi:acyl carrier protein
MDINTFIDNFAGQFDDTDRDVFSPDVKFRDIPEWSSLIALSVIAMVDEEYNVALKGDDIRQSTTIKDIFDIVQSRKA